MLYSEVLDIGDSCRAWAGWEWYVMKCNVDRMLTVVKCRCRQE